MGQATLRNVGYRYYGGVDYMRALITGASGTLGIQVAKAAVEKYGVVALTHSQLDITKDEQVKKAYDTHKPDLVFNCAGIIRPRDLPESVYMDVNVRGPFWLSYHADLRGIKVIQVSTDCVFDGKAGPYDESRTPDAEDVYGKSKSFGEMNHGPHLTVRLSFVGLGKRGLLNWLLSQKGTVKGFRRVLWNGMSAPWAGRKIVEVSGHSGIVHLHGEDMSKHEVLSAANEVFGLGLRVEPVDEPVSDHRLRSRVNGHLPSFREQLMELKGYL